MSYNNWTLDVEYRAINEEIKRLESDRAAVMEEFLPYFKSWLKIDGLRMVKWKLMSYSHTKPYHITLKNLGLVPDRFPDIPFYEELEIDDLYEDVVIMFTKAGNIYISLNLGSLPPFWHDLDVLNKENLRGIVEDTYDRIQ